MNTINLDSSSEDDCDMYVNSVKLLKALQTTFPTNHNDNLNTKKKGEPKKQTKRKGRRHKKAENRHPTCETTEDIEIISVEDCVRPTRKNTKAKLDDSIILDCSSDEDIETDENYDVNVKILWRSKTIHRLNIHKHDNFRKVFQHFADMENVPIERILIMKKEKHINLTDTPSSIGLSIIDILEGGVLNANTIDNNEYQNQRNILGEDMCRIKVQTANKKCLTVPLRKDQQFKILIASCAREWNVNESNIRLYFDGDPVNGNDTPESLDLEQEACIDLRISTK